MSHAAPLSLTPAEINSAATIIAAWPVGWWLPRVVSDYAGHGKDDRCDYIVLDQINGPSFGGFMVGRNFDGRCGVTYTPDGGDGGEEWGPFAGIEGALEAVNAFTLGEIERWGLRSE